MKDEGQLAVGRNQRAEGRNLLKVGCGDGKMEDKDRGQKTADGRRSTEHEFNYQWVMTFD
jgi:hypothetical protein